jgi:hypothetical protein
MSEIIFPESYKNELIQMGANRSRDCWKLGDMASELIAMNAKNFIPQDKVFRDMGKYYGRAGRTIREYHAISMHYKKYVRMEYDVLSFDHFRTAIHYGKKDIEALEWAVAQTDKFNRPATVDEMEEHFANPEREFQNNSVEEVISEVEFHAPEKLVEYVPAMTLRIGFETLVNTARQFGASDETLAMLDAVIERIYREIGVLK